MMSEPMRDETAKQWAERHAVSAADAGLLLAVLAERPRRPSLPGGRKISEALRRRERIANLRRLRETAKLRHQLARRVRQLRLRQRLTQAELAELVGTKQPNIARLESGRTGSKRTFLEKVARALGAKLQVSLTKITRLGTSMDTPENIARLERKASLDFLGSVARGLGAKLDVRFAPLSLS